MRAELLALHNYSINWENIPLVSRAIIWDWGGRNNAIYLDINLGRAALRAARTGVFPLGARGAGRSANVVARPVRAFALSPSRPLRSRRSRIEFLFATAAPARQVRSPRRRLTNRVEHPKNIGRSVRMAKDISARPRQYWDDYASRFKHKSVADAYEHRPPYPEETYEILRDLLGESPGVVLDVGCGPGKIARMLVDFVQGVDAIDFSEEMIRVGKSLANGDHPRLRWIHGRVEEVEWNPPYSMVTAGASIHWMEWRTVFPRFKSAMSDGGCVVIVEGDRPMTPPWREAELALIRKYSTNPHYEDIDLIQELQDRGHFQPLDDRLTSPVCFSQSIRDYVGSFHSRESMSVKHMGEDNAGAFDAELSSILFEYADEGGILSFDLQTRISWGRPLA